MASSLPPLPADLWPQAYPATARRPSGHLLTLEIPGMTEALLLSVLARAIYLEMRGAGEWAARIGTAADKDFPSAKDFSRFRADNAARLLALYSALFAAAQYVGSSDPAPEVLKATASQSYQFACRDEQAKQGARSSGYNDAVYQTEKPIGVTPSFTRRCSPTKS